MALVSVATAGSSDIKCSSKGCIMGVLAAVILGSALIGGFVALAWNYGRRRWGNRWDGRFETEVLDLVGKCEARYGKEEV